MKHPVSGKPILKLTLKETLHRIDIDRERLLQCYEERGIPIRSVALSPSFVCVVLYRISRFFYVKGWGLMARLVWQLNMLFTGADISPICDLGEGLLVVHPVAVTIVGSAGCRLTVEGLGGMGGGLSMDDIGAGPGLPLLGDDVQMARGAMVLGPIRVGNSVRIGPGCTVVRDLPDNSEVLAHQVRIRQLPAKSATGEKTVEGRNVDEL